MSEHIRRGSLDFMVVCGKCLDTQWDLKFKGVKNLMIILGENIVSLQCLDVFPSNVELAGACKKFYTRSKTREHNQRLELRLCSTFSCWFSNMLNTANSTLLLV